MNLNEMAMDVCNLEGKTRQVNIGQTKEILRCIQKIFKANNKNFYKEVRQLEFGKCQNTNEV